MTVLTYVRGAERMITAARLVEDGVWVRFADEHEGVVPLGALALPGQVDRVVVPRPHVIEIHLTNGAVEEVPWDFARDFVDEHYRARSEAATAAARLAFAERLRALRAERGVTQQVLANRAGLSRVSIARIETGEQLPRYRTLVALAGALGLPLDRLLVG